MPVAMVASLRKVPDKVPLPSFVEGFLFGFGLKSNFCGFQLDCSLLETLACLGGGFLTGVLGDSRVESTHKGVNYHLKDVTQTQQERPELPVVTLT